MRKVVTFSLLTVVVLAGLVITLLSASIYTYSALTGETVIAEISFERTGDRRYLAHLRTGDRCTERVLPILGEQWRVDAQFLKWKYWATLLGLQAQYRLDRLEGRYRTAAEQNTSPTLSHDLEDSTALDVVGVGQALGRLNFLTDATYGSSTYEDIDPTRVYYVYRTTTGIITRSEPRPVVEPGRGEALPIEVNKACGGPPSVWKRVANWTNEAAVRVLDLF
jgi:hypothetical protein